MEKSPLGTIDETIVTVDVLANLALVHGAVPVVVAFLASVTRLVIRFQQGELHLTCVVGYLEVEVPEAIIVQAVALVDERLALLEQ